MHQLVQLAYVSRAAALGANARYLLLKRARTDNARRQLTGLLISVGDLYIQALEGEAGMVEAVYNTIARDERHSHPTTLFVRPISERMFMAWRLGFWESRSYRPSPMSIEDVDASVADRLLRHARSALSIGNRAAAGAAGMDTVAANGCTNFSRAGGGAYRRHT
jgi:hypothetical protein